MAIKSLIPRTGTVSEQCEVRKYIFSAIEKWAGCALNLDTKVDLERLEKESGIRCHYAGDNLAGFELVNESAYTLFILKWV